MNIGGDVFQRDIVFVVFVAVDQHRFDGAGILLLYIQQTNSRKNRAENNTDTADDCRFGIATGGSEYFLRKIPDNRF